MVKMAVHLNIATVLLISCGVLVICLLYLIEAQLVQIVYHSSITVHQQQHEFKHKCAITPLILELFGSFRCLMFHKKQSREKVRKSDTKKRKKAC